MLNHEPIFNLMTRRFVGKRDSVACNGTTQVMDGAVVMSSITLAERSFMRIAPDDACTVTRGGNYRSSYSYMIFIYLFFVSDTCSTIYSRYHMIYTRRGLEGKTCCT